MDDKYKMPKVEIGMTVWWWYDHNIAGNKPKPAIVLDVGPDTVCLRVYEDSVHEQVFKDGVRHLTDPIQNPNAIRECGVWDYTDRDKAINNILGERAARSTIVPPK